MGEAHLKKSLLLQSVKVAFGMIDLVLWLGFFDLLEY